MEKTYRIYDTLRGELVTEIPARNERQALERFRRSCMNSGFYHIHKQGTRWLMSSTYGGEWAAYERPVYYC